MYEWFHLPVYFVELEADLLLFLRAGSNIIFSVISYP